MSPKKSKTKPGTSKGAKKKAATKVKPKKAPARKKTSSQARPKAGAKPKKKAPGALKTKKTPVAKAPATAKKASPKAAASKPTPKAPLKAAAKGAKAPLEAPAQTDGTKANKTKRPRRSSRRAAVIRRGPDGEILAPGDLLLPGGPKGPEEIAYLFRGCLAAERPVTEEAVDEVLQKRGVPEGPGEREELQQAMAAAQERFGEGDVEPAIPARNNLKRTFQGVVDRARQRRREIGAFLRGLDMGHTETTHMDAHGEASLQSLMEWAARLENLVENLAETSDKNQGHYSQFHRVLDQLESTTEALVIDVEQTLRRLRDRLRR